MAAAASPASGAAAAAAAAARRPALALALAAAAWGGCAEGGGLPPYDERLGNELWEKATMEVASTPEDAYTNNQASVCGGGNWGDSGQLNQWDQGFSPCWPSSMTISASWDVDLMARWSVELAREFGVPNRGQLGPGINLARYAWNGRLGEYMSGEDPYFGARMIEAQVRAYRTVDRPAIQVVKHFIPNTIETGRTDMIEVVDERTLFEVYYPPFAAAVDAGVSAVMCSYNAINCTTGLCRAGAVYACANDDVLNKHLKQVMGFRGIVMSDWDATKCRGDAGGTTGCKPGQYIDKDVAADGGLDLEMPSCQSFRGGVTKRAQEKATRMRWAFLVQGRQYQGGRRLAGDDPPRRRLAGGDHDAPTWYSPSPSSDGGGGGGVGATAAAADGAGEEDGLAALMHESPGGEGGGDGGDGAAAAGEEAADPSGEGGAEAEAAASEASGKVADFCCWDPRDAGDACNTCRSTDAQISQKLCEHTKATWCRAAGPKEEHRGRAPAGGDDADLNRWVATGDAAHTTGRDTTPSPTTAADRKDERSDRAPTDRDNSDLNRWVVTGAAAHTGPATTTPPPEEEHHGASADGDSDLNRWITTAAAPHAARAAPSPERGAESRHGGSTAHDPELNTWVTTAPAAHAAAPAPAPAPAHRAVPAGGGGGFCCWWPVLGDVCSVCTGKSNDTDAARCRKKKAATWCGAAEGPAPTQAPAATTPLPRPAPTQAPTTSPRATEAPHVNGLVLPGATTTSKAPFPDGIALPKATTTSKASSPDWLSGTYSSNPFGSDGGGASEKPAAPKAPSTPTRVRPAKALPALCPDTGKDNYKSSCKLDLADRIIAESSAVLKNLGGLLPLAKGAKVVLAGAEACAQDPLAIGGGSGWNGMACNQVPKINVRDGIAGLEGGPKLKCPGAGGAPLESDLRSADIVLVVATPAKASEGADRETLQLKAEDVELIHRYCKADKQVIVAMNAPGPVITSTWEDCVFGLMVSWLPGQQNGRGIAMALYAEGYEASGRLPFTFPRCSTARCSIEDERASVALGDRYGTKGLRELTDKALVGYRWYHANAREVSFPFGFGLFAYGSAQVSYSAPSVRGEGSSVEISCELRHSGPRIGRDVPQLYLSFPETVPGDASSKPEWVLKGFAKVEVQPNRATRVSFELSERDLSYWDDSPGKSQWVCAAGLFRACVGANARDAVPAPGRHPRRRRLQQSNGTLPVGGSRGSSNRGGACIAFRVTCPGGGAALRATAVPSELALASVDLKDAVYGAAGAGAASPRPPPPPGGQDGAPIGAPVARRPLGGALPSAAAAAAVAGLVAAAAAAALLLPLAAASWRQRRRRRHGAGGVMLATGEGYAPVLDGSSGVDACAAGGFP